MQICLGGGKASLGISKGGLTHVVLAQTYTCCPSCQRTCGSSHGSHVHETVVLARMCICCPLCKRTCGSSHGSHVHEIEVAALAASLMGVCADRASAHDLVERLRMGEIRVVDERWVSGTPRPLWCLPTCFK